MKTLCPIGEGLVYTAKVKVVVIRPEAWVKENLPVYTTLLKATLVAARPPGHRLFTHNHGAQMYKAIKAITEDYGDDRWQD